MILLKLRNFNNNFEEKLKCYNNGNTNSDIKCPDCNSTDLISHGYYKRNLIYECNHIHIKTIVTIKRVKCKSCGLTHALLPIDIIPYKITSFKIIIKCLFDDDYFNDSSFSYDTREKWFRHFKMFLPYIKTVIGIGKNIYNEISKNFDEFYVNFYNANKKIILMIRSGLFNIGLL